MRVAQAVYTAHAAHAVELAGSPVKARTAPFPFFQTSTPCPSRPSVQFAVQIAESEAAAAAAREKTAELERRLQEAAARFEAAAGERRARDSSARDVEAQLAEARRALAEAQDNGNRVKQSAEALGWTQVAEGAAVEKELAEEKAEALLQELEALKLKARHPRPEEPGGHGRGGAGRRPRPEDSSAEARRPRVEPRSAQRL
eukprot:tig00000219_g19526.t1